MNPKGDSQSVLIVGSGPAGLEAARALSLRGYDVALAAAYPAWRAVRLMPAEALRHL